MSGPGSLSRDLAVYKIAVSENPETPAAPLEHFRLEIPGVVNLLARDHEAALPAIMDGPREARRDRDMRLHDLPDEQAVPAQR